VPLIEIGLFLLPLLVLGLVIRLLKGRIDAILINHVGRGAYYMFAAIGTPVHELSHLITCLLFGHKIKRFSLFSPTSEGRLGFVEHAYDSRNPYHRAGCFFIGISPLIGGSFFLWILTKALFPGFNLGWGVENEGIRLLVAGEWGAITTVLKSALNLFDLYFRALLKGVTQGGWRGPLFFLLVTAVGSHMFPSREDFGVMRPGITLLFNLGLSWGGVELATLLGKSLALTIFGVHLFLFVIFLLLLILSVLLLFVFLKRMVGQ